MGISLFADATQEGVVGRRLLKARIQLALQQPFLAAALMRLPFRECANMSWCPTMATDGYHVFFNPAWTSGLKDAELRGVLAHEVLHVLFAHGDRLQGRDTQQWNRACDYAINLLLIEQGFFLPVGGLISRSFAGLTAEEIYLLIPEEESLRWGGSSIRSSEDEQSGIVPDIGGDLLTSDDPRVSALRDPDTPDKEQMVELRSSLRESAAGHLQGAAAGYFSQECLASEQTKIDWRGLLRQWLQDRIKSDWSSYPFSKKHIHLGLYLPSMGVEAPGHVVFAIDTSGSMSAVLIGEIVAELRAFRETFPCKLTVLQADAAIQEVREYEALDGMEVPMSMKVLGRGGTDFRPVFAWLDKHMFGPTAVVLYATDGYGYYPASDPGWPVIWLLSADGIASEKVPFGMKVRLNGARR
jgi:predicted metal-dependent peptidase